MLCIFIDDDPCEGLSCSFYARCVERDGIPTCQCYAGYYGDGQNCRGIYGSLQYKVLHTKLRVNEIKVVTFSMFLRHQLAMISKCTQCNAENRQDKL